MSGTEIEVRQSNAVAVQDELTIDQLTGQVQKIQQAMEAVMKKGEHYGTIPGAGTKQVLFKAGAEKLCLLFRLDPEYDIVETYHEDGHYTARVTCHLHHITSGNRMGSGVGLCTSKEKKYAYRYDKRTRVQVPNENLPDTFNTVLKMACKRALVAGVLNTTAASDIFTQDLEDAAETVVVVAPSPASRDTYERLISTIGSASKIDPKLWAVEVVKANAIRKFGRNLETLQDLGETEASLIIEGAQAWLAAQIEKANEEVEKAPEPEVSTLMEELQQAQKAGPKMAEETEVVEGEVVEDVDWPGVAPA